MTRPVAGCEVTYCSVTHSLPPILPSIDTEDDPSPCDNVISTLSSNLRMGGISSNDWGVEDVRDACSSRETVVGGVDVDSRPILRVC
jgi:hypothetical protein